MRLRRSGRGQALVEYLILLPTLLLLVLGAIQFALLYRIKSTLNYATFVGARQGALKNASTTSIKDGIAAGMTPLFTFGPDMGSMLKGRAIAMIEVFNPLTMKVTVVNPTADAATDFAVDDPEDTSNPKKKKVIPNDNLTYRPTSAGSKSGISIQDANLMKIRVTYCAKLIVPLANVTIYSLVNGIKGTENLANEWFAESTATATTPNDCSQLKDRFGSKVDSITDAASQIGVDLGFLSTALDDISNALSGATIPGLDWGIGGYRIPITAEAVVRMQSPARFDK
ncbi:MAG TPA: TadE/TadG family type IV pilus assembly protein [Rhodocyclaceae bacterium]